MKSFLLLASFIFSVSSFAQKYTGKWVGNSQDTSLAMILDVTQNAAMDYKATAMILSGKPANIQAIKTVAKNDSLYIYFSQPQANLVLAYNVAKTGLSGYWLQNEAQVSLRLKPLKRPQTPVPPFAYESDSLEYDNADKTVHLGATLTQPKGANKKYPIAILITGSGQQDRDETIFEHKSFAVIADYLTKQGIAVLRVDDRMKGKSKGDLMKATTASFAEDVLTSITFLKTRTDIDTTKIGLIGHSEGGLISYIVYNKWPHLKFIVTLAGQGIAGSDIAARQGLDAYRATHPGKESLLADSVLTTESYKLVAKYKDNDSLLFHATDSFFTKWKLAQKDTVLQQLGIKNYNGTFYANTVAASLRNAWIKYFLTTDPAPLMRNIKCPFLILDGDKDTQVFADENVPAIQAALKQAGNKNVTTHVLKDMNHLFQHCNVGTLVEYGLIEETIAPEVLKIMGDWIKIVIK